MAAEAKSAYGQCPGLSMARRNGALHSLMASKSPDAYFIAIRVLLLFS
jgi:hypothetical protein